MIQFFSGKMSDDKIYDIKKNINKTNGQTQLKKLMMTII
jgi:hypothetical protein